MAVQPTRFRIHPRLGDQCSFDSNPNSVGIGSTKAVLDIFLARSMSRYLEKVLSSQEIKNLL